MIKPDIIDILTKGNSDFQRSLHETDPPLFKLQQSVDNPKRPLAIVVTCSDTRVPVERIFNQDIGSLFVIRNAGVVMSEDVIASVELGLIKFQISQIVVMGHTHCRAMELAVNDEEIPGNAGMIINALRPAIKQTIQAIPYIDQQDLAYSATITHVNNSLSNMKANPLISGLIKRKELDVIGAMYHLRSGEVEWIGR